MTPEEATQALEAAKKEAEEAKQREASEKARNEEMQKRLTEVATENATLRKREEDIGNQDAVKKQQAEVAQISAEAQEIANEFANDPAKAGVKLGQLIAKTKSEAAASAVREFLPRVESYINKRDYLAQMRAEHPEFKEVEKLMAPCIEAKIKAGETLENALKKTMDEFAPVVKPKTNPIAPAGASGYTGANPIPAPAPSAEPVVVYKSFGEHSKDEVVDEINERTARMRKQAGPSREVK
jgi:hypothetical protein